MLIQFRFQNFKSFRDESVLNLSATRISEHSDHVIHIGDEEILPIAAIYGANASGKSNVFEAFRYMKKYVLESFAYGGDEQETEGSKRPRLMPFLFDESSKSEVSLFEVQFIKEEENGSKSYSYGFAMNQDGIAEEWLYAKGGNESEYNTVFYRENDKVDLSGLADSEIAKRMIIPSLYDEVLVVSLGAKLKISELKSVRDWFSGCKLYGFGDPIENIFLSSHVPAEFADDKSVQDKIVKYFAAFDPSITGFQVEKIDDDDYDEEQTKPKGIKIDAFHQTIGSEKKFSIPLREESDGTLKMFAIYPALQSVISNGGILFVDELNAKLHPLLVRLLIVLFLDSDTNPRHAQLVFTTHDAWQLSNHLLRRDEIWFAEKDVSTGVSSIYSLSDFKDEDEKIWNKTNYGEDYLVGKYGAIPNLTKFDVFKEE